MGLWKDKTRKDWCYSFQHQGKTYAGRGFGTKAEARTAREERRTLAKNGTPTQQDTDCYSFLDIASLYLDDAERRFEKKTYEYKKLVFKCFIAHEVSLNGEIPIDQISAQTLHSYLITRPTNNNYNAHRKELCALFTFAKQRLRIIEYNPCWDLEKLPHTPRKKRVPAEEEVLRLLMAADPATRALLQVIILTVARVDEILRLRWGDVNFDNMVVTKWTRKRKGGSYEPVPIAMNQDLYDILWRLWTNRQQDEYVFYNEKTKDKYNRRPKLMPGLCKKAGITPPFGFHDLRHFIASMLADHHKISKKTISGMLGHKSLSTTEIYLHSIDESQRLAVDAINGSFGDESLVAGLGCGSHKKTRNQTVKPATKNQ